MKVKFTKLAALLLAGVALFATGCTDYEVDIQKVDKKVDNLTTEVNNKIASLEQQIAGINATIATLETKAAHDADIQTLRNELAAAKSALQDEFNGKINKAVADLTAEINKKVNQADYDVDKAKIEKAIKDVNDALNAAKDRIKALEDADFQGQIDAATDRIKALEDAHFQDQIDAAKDRITKLENLLAGDWDGKTVKETIDALAKTVADLETEVNGKINALDERLTKAEAAIDDINKVQLPALRQRVKDIEDELPTIRKNIEDLQNGKLDKAEFDEYYKKAYEKYTKATIEAIQGAIGDLAKLKTNDKTSLVNALNEVWDKFDDYVLQETFDAFVEIAATKEELQLVKKELEGRIEVCEDLLEGDWGGKTVQEYIDDKVDGLQAQIDKIVKELIPALDLRVGNLEDTVNNTILPQIQFAIGYESKYAGHVEGYDFANGLQGYIQDMAMDTFIAACQYADQEVAKVRKELNAFKAEMYNLLQQLASRIQSIVYVPDYDDLKITSNMAVVTQDGLDKVVVFDQPTDITYEILPAKYASVIAENFNDYLVFDVKPVNTRSEDADNSVPSFTILSASYDPATVDETGQITFTVLPVNVASEAFAATDIPVQWTPMFGWTSTTITIPFVNISLNIPSLGYDEGWVYPIVTPEDLEAFKGRSAFAASLRFVCQDVDIPTDPASEEYNEVASTYNVLFPAITNTFDIDVYKPEKDPDTGEPTGKLVLVGEEWQYLPYSSLRTNTEDEYDNNDGEPIGELPDADPTGYRIIQDGAIPGISIDGGEPMTLAEAAAAGYVVPSATIAFEGFTYFKDKAAFEADTEGNVDKELFVETPQVYAQFEMNPAKEAIDRKAALGNVASGNYIMKTIFGETPFSGQVEITKPLGEVKVDATIAWTWKYDAVVDHNKFYQTGEEPTIYSRIALPINVDEDDLANLVNNLALKPSDFSNVPEKSFKFYYTDEDGNEVDVTDQLKIKNIAVDDEFNLTADISNFEWGYVYNVVAEYELESALITVKGTITTVDRNREPVVLGPYEHTFIVNDPDEYYDGYYHWTSDPLYGDIFKAFNDEGVINLELNKEGDFEYDAEKEEFAVAELEGKLKAAADAGTAKGYIDIKNAEDVDVYAWTMKTVTPAILAGDIFSSGETEYELKKKADPNDESGDPNLWIGNIVTRNITTYIGEEVQFSFKFNYKVPDYNFLHLRFYTFNTDEELDNFITKLPLPEEIDGVASPYDLPNWYTRVNPSYFTEPKTPNTSEADAQKRVSFRHALYDYDVKYINLAELAFNVVDENDEIIEDAQLAELGLAAKFWYRDTTKLAPARLDANGCPMLPEPDQKASNNEFLLYHSLWVDNTTFYYLTNEHPYIPAVGTLTLTVGDVQDGGYAFPVATRFEYTKPSVKFGVDLNYSKYAVVRWTPFQKLENESPAVIILDENKIYREPLLKGLYLKDNRPNGVSYYVIKDGKWVVGNVTSFDAEAGTYSTGGNGYISGVNAREAYHIKADIDYSDVEIPVELKKLMSIVYSSDGVTFVDKQNEEGTLDAYVQFDYTSEVQFHGVVKLGVSVSLENPWQETLSKSFNIIIKGVGD